MEEPLKEITEEFIMETISKGKEYYLVTLGEGIHFNAENNAIRMEHVRYLLQLRESGIIVLVGPVTDEANIKGLSIFNLQDKEQVKMYVESDPAVKSGHFSNNINKWFGLPGDSLPR